MRASRQTVLRAVLTGLLAVAGTTATLGCETTPLSRQHAMTGVREKAHAIVAVVATAMEREEALRLLVDAARDDATVRNTEASRFEPLVAASEIVLGERLALGSPGEYVAETLARSRDPRATTALIAWVSRPTTSSMSCRRVLRAMKSRPVAAYLDAVRSLLAQPERATELVPSGLDGALGAVFGRYALASLQVDALLLARAIGDDASLDLLRRLSVDRSLPSPDPRALQALRCPQGRGWRGGQSRDKAEALASQRIVALGLLGDHLLFDALARDPDETPVVRLWAAAMAKASELPPLPRVTSGPGLGVDLIGVAHLGPSDDDGNFTTDCDLPPSRP